jgi:AAA-like domain
MRLYCRTTSSQAIVSGNMGDLYMCIRSMKVCDKYRNLVRQRATERYVTQEFLAVHVDMSRSTISKYLNCREVFTTTFMEISWALGFEDWKDIACLPNSAPLGEHDSSESISYRKPPVIEKCCQVLSKPGTLLKIKAPRKRGKTTTALDILTDLRDQQSYRTVYLSLDSADNSDYQSFNSFLKWFCLAIGSELNIPNQQSDYWDKPVSKVRCTSYVENIFLLVDDRPLVLCIDRLDRIFPHVEIARDFFGLLRSWHEKAKSREIWQNLRLMLLYCTENYGEINPLESPFNIGILEKPPEFTAEQTSMLAEEYGLPWSSENTQQLRNAVGGHPYLIDEMLTHWKDCPRTLDEQLKLEADPTSDEIYSIYLQLLWRAVTEDSILVIALNKILDSLIPVPIDSMDLIERLIDIGIIIRTDGNLVQPYCQLFRDYFQARINRLDQK